MTAAVHSKRPLYHASISPEADKPLDDDQVRIAADTLERKLGLSGQPRVIVVHRKMGREHVHVVWSRIDLEHQRVISDAWNYAAHEEAARELELAFGHRAVAGAFTPRRQRATRDYEYQQAERSGKSPQKVSDELSGLWRGSGSAEAFKNRLEEAGYRLARGDRRVFVVIDQAGNVHSLARRLGMATRDLRALLGGMELKALPSVDEVRAEANRQPHRHPLRTRYRAAKRETTTRAQPRKRAPTRRADRDSNFRAAAGWINLAEQVPEGIARVTRSHFVTLARLRVIRADILADFAAKMDEAVRRLSDDALFAALNRLADERDAALRALARLTQPNLHQRRGQRVRKRRRFRPRRRPNPPVK